VGYTVFASVSAVFFVTAIRYSGGSACKPLLAFTSWLVGTLALPVLYGEYLLPGVAIISVLPCINAADQRSLWLVLTAYSALTFSARSDWSLSAVYNINIKGRPHPAYLVPLLLALTAVTLLVELYKRCQTHR